MLYTFFMHLNKNVHKNYKLKKGLDISLFLSWNIFTDFKIEDQVTKMYFFKFPHMLSKQSEHNFLDAGI